MSKNEGRSFYCVFMDSIVLIVPYNIAALTLSSAAITEFAVVVAFQLPSIWGYRQDGDQYDYVLKGI